MPAGAFIGMQAGRYTSPAWGTSRAWWMPSSAPKAQWWLRRAAPDRQSDGAPRPCVAGTPTSLRQEKCALLRPRIPGGKSAHTANVLEALDQTKGPAAQRVKLFRRQAATA